MENFFAQFDNLFAPVNERLSGINRSDVVRYTAIYMLVVGILSLCGGVGLIGIGGLGGLGAVVGSVAVDATTGAALGAASGFAIIAGLLALVSGPVMIGAAIGLFQRKEWGRNLAVIAFVIHTISSIVGLFFGSGIFNLLWIVIDFYLAYFFARDNDLKSQFS